MNCSSEKFDLRVCGKVPFLIFSHKQEKVDTSKKLSKKYLSKPLWRSTFSLKESKSLQHSKENLFELCLNGYISRRFCSLKLQIMRLFRARSSKTIECRFTLKRQKQPPEVFCKKGSS